MSDTDTDSRPIAITAELSLPRRAGPRPDTTVATPGTNIAQQQISQNAPLSLQEVLFQRTLNLPHITTGPSLVSVPGARAFFLDEAHYKAPMLIATEFGHIHPAYDGSFHLNFTLNVVARITESGWGQAHDRVPMVALIYGPRDEPEMEIVWSLIELAYRYAKGEVALD